VTIENPIEGSRTERYTMDKYLSLMEDTEPPYLFHRWCFLSIVATALGRRLWFPFGESNIYPNMFTVLIGPPASRKSTAIKHASKLLEESGYESFAGDRSSKEKFLADWEHGFDKIYRGVEPGNVEVAGDGLEEVLSRQDKGERVNEAFIKAGELQDFLGGGNATFISMLTNLWDNLPHYSDRFKNSASVYISNPTVNILGGATSTSFAEMFSSNIIGQGMFSRLILVNGKSQRRKITIPPALSFEKKAEIIEILREIRTNPNLNGPISITQDASQLLTEIYTSTGGMVDSRLITYSGRRLDHLIKLAIVICATEFTREITEELLILANTILSYTELYMPNALGEFGKAKNADVSQSILDVVISEQDSGGITGDKLFERVSQNISSFQEFGMLTQKLLHSKRIRQVEIGGRKVFMGNQKKFEDRNGIDFNLMWEYQTREQE
jgi:hypothetical protein